MSPWAKPKSVMTRFRRKKKIWISCALAKARTRMPGRLVMATPANTYTRGEKKEARISLAFFFFFHWLLFTGGYLLRCPFWPWPPWLVLHARAERSVQMIWSYGTQTQQRCPQPVDSIGKKKRKKKAKLRLSRSRLLVLQEPIKGKTTDRLLF